MLGGRLGKLLPSIIEPSQTAFVAGRGIGENVLLIQSLAERLKQQNKTALWALCDFRKAYDTIDRDFLFAVVEELGLGAGFSRWVRLLLSDTKGAALVRGCLATPRRFKAGVRQGCPLSPYLYLLIGQALLCWLKERGIGMDLGDGIFVVASQYADDTAAPLECGAAGVAAFLAAMARFADASGQHLEPTKTKLLPLGAVREVGATVEGLQVVAEATSLGFRVAAFFSGEVSADFEALEEMVCRRMTRAARMKLSMLGMANVVNTSVVGICGQRRRQAADVRGGGPRRRGAVLRGGGGAAKKLALSCCVGKSGASPATLEHTQTTQGEGG